MMSYSDVVIMKGQKLTDSNKAVYSYTFGIVSTFLAQKYLQRNLLNNSSIFNEDPLHEGSSFENEINYLPL